MYACAKITAQSDRQLAPRSQFQDETTGMVGTPSRRIRAPANALVVWAVHLGYLIPKNAVPLLDGLSDLGAREIFDRVQQLRSCQQMLLRHHPLLKPKAMGRRPRCTSWQQGGCQACWLEPNFIRLSYRPTPLTTAQDDLK